MNSNGHDSASRDLSHAFGSQLVLCLLADIDVAGDFCTSTRVHDVLCDLRVTNDGRVLLAWRDSCAVASEVLVNCRCVRMSLNRQCMIVHTQETLALAGVSNSCEDNAMSMDVGSESDERNGGS